jgi:hypothetical protein
MTYALPSELDSYDGEWLNGRQQGTGTMTWRDGGKYAGEWAQGFRSGRGRMDYPANDTLKRVTYEGDWEGGRYTNLGELRLADGESYAGQWQKGYRHGQGSILQNSISARNFSDKFSFPKSFGDFFTVDSIT